jgi:hypothetical protein
MFHQASFVRTTVQAKDTGKGLFLSCLIERFDDRDGTERYDASRIDLSQPNQPACVIKARRKLTDVCDQ